MTRSGTYLALAVVATVWSVARGQLKGPPSPASEFLIQPSNTTVPEGEQVVLKCLVASPAHVCRWYFLEWGLDFFDPRVAPMLVKDFSPAHHRDCSIRIKKARKVQEGQWLCQALRFHTSHFSMTHPAVLRVITEGETWTWEPLPQPTPTPRQSRGQEPGSPEDGITPGNNVEFDSSHEDYIQNAALGDSVILKCQINLPISSCSWVMPHGAFFNLSQDLSNSSQPSIYADDYRLEGDLSEGNCTLRIREVRLQDEGDWRCLVQAEEQYSQGPLLHLHIAQDNTHSHEGTPLIAPEEASENTLITVLVVMCSFLLLMVVLLFTCLYRRVKNGSEETRKILPGSPRGSIDLSCKTLPTTDLTQASVLAVDVRKKRLPCLPLDQYNQYLDMNGTTSSIDGYIMMPGSSLRSSTSSRTTLSTLSTLPCGRSRSASSSTTLSVDFPHLTNHVDNPSYSASPHLNRPDSLYKADHVYEEIKEKDPSEKMEKIPEVTTPVTPTYTNIIADIDGYLIPRKSPPSEALLAKLTGTQESPRPPAPDPPLVEPGEAPPAQPLIPSPGQADPYSVIGECGLVPASPTHQPATSPGPGYSRVGSVNPMERYDTPRPLPINHMEGYDIPRRVPAEPALQSNIPVSTEVCVNALPGTIV